MKIAVFIFTAIVFLMVGCGDYEIKRDFKISSVASFPYEIEGLKSRWYFCEKCLKDKTCISNNVKQCNYVTKDDNETPLMIAA